MSESWDADGPVRPAPQGARANAVPPPAAWTPLVEVDHRVSQPLLDSLEDAGVAAYAEPRPHATAPLDRIHVDATRREAAEAVVSAELPGLLAELGPEEELDPFDAIVAAWDAVPEAPTWPAAEDVLPAHKPERDGDDPVPAPPRRVVREEHFVPPPAPPVTLPASPAKRYAVVALVLGVVVLVVLPLVGRPQSSGVQAVGAISVLAGLATLIYTMRDGPSVDDGPDDGAVV